MLGHQEPTTPQGRVEAELARVVDRLRSMSLARLAAPLPPYDSRADAAREIAQRLADAAADLAGDVRRPVPRLGDQVVGDQVAVTGHDLLDAARRASADAVGDEGASAERAGGEPGGDPPAAARVAGGEPVVEALAVEPVAAEPVGPARDVDAILTAVADDLRALRLTL